MLIYKITNKINGKVYIGQTVNSLEIRFKQHCYPRKSLISQAIQKYGKENFVAEVLLKTECSVVINCQEILFIKKHKSISPYGYNLEPGGNAGKRPSEQTRLKQRMAHLGKPAPWNSYKRSSETLKKMSEISKGRAGYWAGKKRGPVFTKPVVCLNNNKRYISAREASKDLNISYSAISDICSKKKQSVKGFKFVFEKDIV